jgi:hypothetical protein
MIEESEQRQPQDSNRVETFRRVLIKSIYLQRASGAVRCIIIIVQNGERAHFACADHGIAPPS